MKMISNCGVVVLLLFLCYGGIGARGIKPSALQSSYKKVGDELVGLRKQYPGAQEKIYGILDQVDKIYKVARVALEQSDDLSKRLKERDSESKEALKSKDLENISLQNEVIALKSVLDSTQHKLEVATKSLELEKKYTNKLTNDLAKLVQEKKPGSDQVTQGKKQLSKSRSKGRKHKDKLEAMAENSFQSLNLTSSSAPNSPR